MKCPNCGNDTISIWQRLCIAPAHPVKCKVCGKKIAVLGLHAFLSLLPFTILFSVGISLNNKILHFLLPALGIVITLVIHIFFTPLQLYENVFYEGKS
jgi:Oxygen-sensitive ribonucleoside-triphosphate reductase